MNRVGVGMVSNAIENISFSYASVNNVQSNLPIAATLGETYSDLVAWIDKLPTGGLYRQVVLLYKMLISRASWTVFQKYQHTKLFLK